MVTKCVGETRHCWFTELNPDRHVDHLVKPSIKHLTFPILRHEGRHPKTTFATANVSKETRTITINDMAHTKSWLPYQPEPSEPAASPAGDQSGGVTNTQLLRGNSTSRETATFQRSQPATGSQDVPARGISGGLTACAEA